MATRARRAPKRAAPTPEERDFAAIAAAYEDAVLSGGVLACRETIAACQRNHDDLARKTTSERVWEYRYDPQKGVRVCKFLELLPHIKGPQAGKRLRLEPAQVWAVMTMYSWVKPDGKRRFSRAYYEVARGNGKSAISSGLALYHLCADGDEGAEIYSAATTAKQAKIVWDVAKAMARKCPDLIRAYGVKLWAHSINVPKSASKFEPVSSRGETQDGYNISLAVLDELHAHKSRELYDVMETGCGKRPQSMLLCITTAGTNRAGICFEIRSYVRKVITGQVIDDAQFGIIYTLDPDDDWRDPSVLPKANPLWGVSVDIEKVLGLQLKATNTPSAVNNFKTKHCNVWCSAGNAFFHMPAFDAGADPTLKLEDFRGQPCWIGVDLASKVDIASKTYVFKQGEKRIQFERHYLNQQALNDGRNSQYAGWAKEGFIQTNPGPVTSHVLILEELVEDCELFTVREVGVDPHNATLLSEKLASYTEVVEVRQSVIGMSEPTKALDALIRAGNLRHTGNPVTGWMFSNVVVTPDKKDNVYPFKDKPENKIDGAISSIIAHSRAAAEVEDPKVARKRAMDAFLGITRKAA